LPAERKAATVAGVAERACEDVADGRLVRARRIPVDVPRVLEEEREKLALALFLQRRHRFRVAAGALDKARTAIRDQYRQAGAPGRHPAHQVVAKELLLVAAQREEMPVRATQASTVAGVVTEDRVIGTHVDTANVVGDGVRIQVRAAERRDTAIVGMQP